jgi:pimeloyl-ACP methyl ester carboxylesterase
MKSDAHCRVPPPSDFPFEAKFVTVGSHRIHYVEEGSGDPVLFLHGNPTSSSVFRNVLGRVAKDTGRRTSLVVRDFGAGYHFLSEEDPNRVAMMVSDWLNELRDTKGAASGIDRARAASRTMA